jgi:hypothetical protein
MAFEKGHKKLGGKIKGSVNKSTKDIKEAYKMLIENNLDNLTSWLELIAEKDPKAAIYILADLSEYVIPKLARTDITSKDESIIPKFDLSKLSDEEIELMVQIQKKLSD